MKLWINWRSALQSIVNNRKRSLLTMIGIVIGIASVITILAIGRGFERDTIRTITQSESTEIESQVYFEPTDYQLYDSNADFFQQTDLENIRQIAGVKNVRYADPLMNFFESIEVAGESKSIQVELVEKSEQKVVAGRNLRKFDNDTSNKVVILDKETAKKLFGSVSAALHQVFALNGDVFRIVGIFEHQTQQASASEAFMYSPEIQAYFPEQTYRHYLGQKENTNYLSVSVAAGVNPAKVQKKIIKQLESRGTMRHLGKYGIYDESEMTEGIGSILSTITLFVTAVAAISLFIAGVGVMNMMYISVSERTKEIGIRRALGATKKNIRTQFLLEGLTLTLSGGIVGYLIGMLLASLVGSLLKISVAIDLFTISLAVGVSSVVGLIFSVMPASEAARKDLIDILR